MAIRGLWGPILGVLVIVIIVIIGWIFWNKKRTSRKREEVRRLIKHGAGIKEFDISDIKKATKNFNPKCRIGTGAQGDVFAANLYKDKEKNVAVKRLFVTDENSASSEFHREITILSHIRHQNIVSLLGCSYQKTRPILVYEFLSGGDLYTLLHENRSININWSDRYEIVVKIADALDHLHFNHIFHRDIKSRNVLLDDHLQPKLGDFGISKLCSGIQTTTGQQRDTTSLVKGTPGYICPEYQEDGKYTASSDVYSFGVLLAELLTRQKAIFAAENGLTYFLGPYFAREAATNLEGILDTQLKSELDNDDGDMTILNQIKGVSSIICRCVAVFKKDRPTMARVLRDLKALKKTTPPEMDGGPEDDEINNSDAADTAAMWNKDSDV